MTTKRKAAYHLYIGAALVLTSNSYRPLVRHALKTMKPGEAGEIRHYASSTPTLTIKRKDA